MSDSVEQAWVWIFSGDRSSNPSGVFSTKDLAEQWIKENGLAGLLTRYPVNLGVYDWAVSNGHFKVKREEHRLTSFIQTFTSASQEHYHYQDGSVAE